jgi:hypothetical protein
MSATVRINDIVEALEMPFDEHLSSLDLDTGRVETVSRELLLEAEESDDDDEPDIPAWQQPEWEIAKRIAYSDRFQKLPTKFDVHEWNIMQEFSSSVKSARIREELLDAIHGAGAFRNFRTNIERHRLESAWFQFRTEALRQIAVDWCEEYNVPWE